MVGVLKRHIQSIADVVPRCSEQACSMLMAQRFDSSWLCLGARATTTSELSHPLGHVMATQDDKLSRHAKRLFAGQNRGAYCPSVSVSYTPDTSQSSAGPGVPGFHVRL